MSTPTSLQSKTYTSSSASTSHNFTLSSAVTSQGGSVGPSSFVMTFTYDSASALTTSVTDSSGNTWVKAGSGVGDASTFYSEVWYAIDVIGGATPTITIGLSSSQSVVAVLAEVDQIRPISAYDQIIARKDVTSSSSRTSGNATSLIGGQIAVRMGALGWKDSTLDVSSAGSTWGNLIHVKDATSLLGAALEFKSADTASTSKVQLNARFTMNASSTKACSVFGISFYRDGVTTSTAEDGWIDDIEGTPTIYNTDGSAIVYTSSTSAPYGGTGGSERAVAYGFMPNIEAYLKAGVTIGSTFTLYYNVASSYEDGNYFEIPVIDWHSDGALGTTIDTGDEFPFYDGYYYLGAIPSAGINTQTLTTATDYSTTNSLSWMMSNVGDTMGSTSGSYVEIYTYEAGIPTYCVFSLDYPVPATGGGSTLAMMGVG